MNFADYVKRNNEIYMRCLARDEKSHLAVNWGSKLSQEKRFEVLSGISEDFKRSSILDVGCGLGHFVEFLLKKNFQGLYKGIDILSDMVEIAKSRYPKLDFSDENLFIMKDSTYDYVSMSGIFTLANWKVYTDMILHAYRVSRKGVAFNSLSLWACKQEKNEFYADPIKTLEFCKSITHKIVFKHDYLPNDFTIYLYKYT